LALLYRLLKPGGLLVFTTHGDQAIDYIAKNFYGERIQDMAAQVEAEYRQAGFCFTPYERKDFDILPFEFKRDKDFGVTWMTEAYVSNLVEDTGHGDLQCLRFNPHGWENYQDVYICQRRIKD
jgi:hypothetical protein